ncbi:uncharacterized protein LOC123525507 [Mercenaria mercenaria]|uniref:uncharacterized protein LOC123525507 n=1 Tax=Mercenaria mercenaria TaxID=6596 RepID=UPI00234F5FD0|nr:uncharacterized protein LOC123525507 [Mercenaria mercenaria]XP_053393788.1 uncharacterized protein LOC123525507 [Mercenaria mercenaria]
MSVAQYPGRRAPGLSTTSRINYTVNSCFPSRKPRPNSLKGNKTFKKDIKDTMQHAALINIVAAVNESMHEPLAPRQSSGSSLRSTVTVISNFMFPHEKTVSIPQSKQRIFNMPDEIVQRKPVYYKHSGDLEVRTQSHIRFYDEGEAYNLKLKKNETVPKTKSSQKDIIKSLPNKPRILDISFTDPHKKKPDVKHKLPSEYEVRITSGVRRLGSVKKSEVRKVYELPKCDAVDIQDTHENKTDQLKTVLDDTKKIVPPVTPPGMPFIRNKSLPVIFPTKTINRASSSLPLNQRQPTLYRDRPLSQSLRKQTPDSMYKRINHLPNGFAYGSMSINNGINQAPDITGKLVHDSEKQLLVRASLSSNSKQRFNQNIRSPPSPTNGCGGENVFITLQNEFPDYQARSSGAKSYKSKHSLNEAVRNTMSGRVARIKSEETKESSRQVTSARSRKSCLTSRSGLSETLSGYRTPKKVQFLSSDSSLSSCETNSVKEEPKENADVHGGSGIIQAQTPTSVLRAYSPGIQPMSARELLRLEQKILPANTPPPPPDILANYYATNSLINVQTLQRTNSDISTKICDSTGNDTDNEESDNVFRDSENDHNNRHNQNDNTEDTGYKSEVESEFCGYSDSNDIDEANEVDESDNAGFYKLVKAVDKQPYEGFEHKKIRRSSSSSKSKDHEKDSQKAQYVKIRLS